MGFLFPFSHFVASSLNLWGWWHVRHDCHFLRQTYRGHRVTAFNTGKSADRRVHTYTLNSHNITFHWRFYIYISISISIYLSIYLSIYVCVCVSDLIHVWFRFRLWPVCGNELWFLFSFCLSVLGAVLAGLECAPIRLGHGGPAPKGVQWGSHMWPNCPKLMKLQVMY